MLQANIEIFFPMMPGPIHSAEMLVLQGLIVLALTLTCTEEGPNSCPALSVRSSIHNTPCVVVTFFF